MVYFDWAASAPLTASAAAAMTDAFSVIGNPSSIHAAGQRAKQLVEQAREAIAGSVGADAIEIVLTGSGTESVNLAIQGLFRARNADGSRPVVIAPAGEHHATVDTLRWLSEHAGADWIEVPISSDGIVSVAAIRAALAAHGDRVALITALWANNEVGSVNPVIELVRMAAEAAVPLHLDAIAAYGSVPIDFTALRADAPAGVGLVALSLSAHKIGGPGGIGALVLTRTAKLEPLVHGGGQQRKLHSGTQNLLGAVGFAAAAREVTARLADSETHDRVRSLRDRLIAGVLETVPGARLCGPAVAGHGASGDLRLPGNAHFTVEGCQGDSLLFLLDAEGIQVSTGSACQAGVPEPSHVLLAMGYSEAAARGALRFTLGWSTTEADVDALLAALPHAVARARAAGMSERRTSFDR
ncbi:MAG TPA: cysteine desulfurase family protein [Candidatus Lumbricidophila sp.]|nr:cysteine desulfurase family protein [Candidatus Lumbricidophila sp.]